MDIGIVFSQMMVLLGMMLCGYIASAMNWLTEDGEKHLSTLVVKVFNTILIIYSAVNVGSGSVHELVGQDVFMVFVYYAAMIVIGFIYVHIRGLDKKESCRQQLMFIFPNVGFMGVPLVRALFGEEYVILLVFYMLGFNLLSYTYGIYLAMGMADHPEKFEIRRVFNMGLLTAVAAVVLFLLHVQFPAPLLSFCNYMGNATIPLSMMVIGASLYRLGIRNIFREKENYVFLVLKQIAVPIVIFFLARFLPVQTDVRRIFCLVVSMPVGSFTGMLAEEYGHSGDRCNKMIALTTIVSVATIPLLAGLY